MTGRAHAAAFAIATGALVLMLAIAYGVFRAQPFCMDEYGYLYQAEIFASGRTHLEVPAELAPLREMYVIWHDGALFSKYPPGFSMVLAVGVKLGAPAAVNPLLAALTLLLIYLVALRLVGRTYALIAELLVATNPLFLGYSASLFSHTLTLALAMTVLAILTMPGDPGVGSAANPDPTTPYGRWLALGAVLGVFVWVRPVDALAAALFTCFVVVRSIGWRRAVVAGAIALGPLLAFTLALMAYNARLSGRFAISTYPVLDGEFRVVAGEHLGFFENLVTIADEYVRRLVLEGELLIGRYFAWPAGIAVPLLALAAVLLRAGERAWRIALVFHFVVVVLLYNFHGMPSPVPTWPQYGVRYWYSGLGAVFLLAVFSLANLVTRARQHPKLGHLVSRRTGAIAIAAIVIVQLAIGSTLFREYAHRFAGAAAIEREIAETCPGKRLVALDLPSRSRLPLFVRAEDRKRNPFLDGERLYVIGRYIDPALLRALPGYTPCRYDFGRWDAAR